MIFRAIDLETNGVDVLTCEVGQVSIVTAPEVEGLPELSDCATSMVYCAVQSMPAGATAVNGLTVGMLAEHPRFVRRVRGVVRALLGPDAVIVTFNGAGFDLPVVARYADKHGGLSGLLDLDVVQLRKDHPAAFEDLFAAKHVDVYRCWQVVRKRELWAPWLNGLTVCFSEDAHRFTPSLHAGMFAGSLVAAYGFYVGQAFEGAHDASVDCRATLAVLAGMLREKHFTLEEAQRCTVEPLPGDVDFEGKLRWVGDQAVCTFGKFRDVPLEKVERGFLQWMLSKDFHRHTKQIVREYLAGRYPERDYESS